MLRKAAGLALFGVLSFALVLPASAQSPKERGAALLEPLPIPLNWSERSGIEIGLEIKAIAEQEGTPFDESLVQPHGRPAIGLDVVRRGRNLLVLADNDGSIRRATFGGQAAWQQVLRTVYTLYPDRFDMVMALTEWQERTAAAYYLPLANDTRGLGYLHLSGRDLFNNTGSNLDGLIFMNDYRSYIGRNEVYGRVVFLQEIGHRWGSFVYYGNGPGNGRDILGRDQSHWSYFLQSGNSALEGNDWRDNRNGSFTTQTNAFRLGFSDLDLYLMGFKPQNEVADFFLIRDVNVRGQRDDFGRTLNAASPPAFGRSTTVSGTRHDITINDVVTAEGARNPGFDTAQKVWSVATVLILNQGSRDSWGDSQQRVVEDMLDDWEAMFETETGNVADLVLTLEDSPPEPDRDFGEECTSTDQCNPDNSTVCLTTDDGRICSKRCGEASECGNGYCCAESFCYPSGDDLCQALLPDECSDNSDCGFGCCNAGSCGDCPDLPQPDMDMEDEECIEGFTPSGFACECVGFDCPPPITRSTGNVQPSCQAAPAHGPASLVSLLLMLLALLGGGLRLRRVRADR